MLKSTMQALALGVVFLGAGNMPAWAQDGIGLRQIFGSIGLLPRTDREAIEYRDRPALVVPKDRNALRPPEDPNQVPGNAAWPNDPDVEARKLEMERRRGPAPGLANSSNVAEARRLGIDELRTGRSPRGAVAGETSSTLGNDRAGVRLSPSEWAAQQQSVQATNLPAGVEPPRVFLTDPPRGLRQPASSAPVARTRDAPSDEFDNFRPTDTWRRLD
ncbi:hypothetical protein MCEMSEM23_00085 [Rhabdaerophilaceae bacterium]